MSTAAETEAFKDSALPLIGIVIGKSERETISSLNPFASLPRSKTLSLRYSALVIF